MESVDVEGVPPLQNFLDLLLMIDFEIVAIVVSKQVTSGS